MTDKDMFNETIDQVFTEARYQASELKIGKEDDYILALSLNQSGDEVLTASSNNDLLLCDVNTLAIKRKILKAHKATITGLVFHPTEPNLFFTSSMDQAVKQWDTREDGNKPSLVFEDTSRQDATEANFRPAKPLMSMDVSSNGKLICAGTEQVVKDSFILFWDVRKSQLMGGYWDSHEDDVTVVKFHPDQADTLASSGTDGIVNVFDVSESCEDDALQTSINTISSVQKLCWFHGKGGTEWNSLAVVTHTEEIHLWQTEDVGPYHCFSRDDLCAGVKRSNTDFTYVVDVFETTSHQDTHQLKVLAGSSCPDNPCLRLLDVKKTKLKPRSNLEVDSNKMIRCTRYLRERDGLLTGGEDGVVRLWLPGSDNKAIKNGKK